jgi:hypothetical protein
MGNSVMPRMPCGILARILGEEKVSSARALPSS